DIWLNPRSQRLVWPDDESRLAPPSFHREIRTHRQAIVQRKGQSTYQQDVETWDRAFVQEDVRRKAGTQSTPKKILNQHEMAELNSKSVAESDSGYESAGSMETKAMEVALLAKTSEPLSSLPGKENQNSNRKPWVPRDIRRHTERLDQQDNLRKMECELQGKPPAMPITRKITIKCLTNLPPVDIYCIGAVGFYRTLIKPDTESFITSLYEIDWIIEEKEAEAIQADSAREEFDNEKLINQKLPCQYHDLRDVFSKAASDILPPHCKYDLKIELERDHNLGFSPLYQYTAEELRTCKQYLVENLSKGFIDASQAPFAAPILFAWKANGGLRFCVDYRKLNAVTRKDHYP